MIISLCLSNLYRLQGPSNTGRLLAGIVCSNTVGGMDVCLSLVSFVCGQVEVSASGLSLVQRSATECGVSKWVWSWSLKMRSPWPTGGCCAMERKKKIFLAITLLIESGTLNTWLNWDVWWDRYVVSKRRLQTNLCRAATQKISSFRFSLFALSDVPQPPSITSVRDWRSLGWIFVFVVSLTP